MHTTRDNAGEIRAAPFSPLLAAQLVAGRYEIRRLLGRGGMGRVWLAHDTKLRVDVALKDLVFTHDRSAEAVRNEVRAAREVISPNVCRIFDSVEWDGRELVAMEFIDGETLRQIAARGPLAAHDAQPIASQLLAGLEAIHAAGLIHRDLKPDNVMVTRTGRVVIMDFGLARAGRDRDAAIAGTPGYMAPEQMRGEELDAGADVFAAAVLFSEITAPDARWASVLQRASSAERSARFASAREFARALEDATTNPQLAVQPYPGLSPFEEGQSRFFFGREAEVESLLRKIERAQMLAIVGPSGAGKTSFIHAGVLPMLPRSWGALKLRPGSSATANFREQLGTDGESDSAIRNWRSRFPDAIIVVDQFEELFTLNAPPERARFTELLARAAEADAKIVLLIRDDFLLACHDYPALEPIFRDLTPLRAPAGSALRRALVEPAIASGCRFEGDDLVSRMLEAVGSGRGSLPLLAFAAAQLWKRRRGGVLTRAAYEEIGGVEGALARHADETLHEVGSQQLPLAREIFRSLVTARGTRRLVDRVELLSLFGTEDREAAEMVLDKLIARRLVTSFEVNTDAGPRTQIEIIHESLLTAWPRLVHWQAQDAEGALMRDHVRQAAQLWDERGRPADLLWSGNAYREFRVWRARYAGSLSAIEEQFARTMIANAERRRRRVRVSVGAALAVAVAIATAMTFLWRGSVAESRRAEAQKLLALAQVEMDRYPAAALAYITRSLEIGDSNEGRLLMMQALWKGPVPRILQLEPAFAIHLAFSPDGRTLAAIGDHGPDFLVSHDGLPPRPLHLPFARSGEGGVAFSDRGRLLVIGTPDEAAIVSASEGRVVRSIPKKLGFLRIGDSWVRVVSRAETSGPLRRLDEWPLPEGGPVHIGTFKGEERGDLYPGKPWMVRLVDGAAFREPINLKPRKFFWRPFHVPFDLTFNSTGEYLAATTEDGFEVMSLEDGRSTWLPISSPGDERLALQSAVEFRESRLAAATIGSSPRVWVWDVRKPDDTALALRIHGDALVMDVSSHPAGNWIATSTNAGAVFFWPLRAPHARVLRIRESADTTLDFTPDSKWLASCAEGDGLRLWSLDGSHQSRLLNGPKPLCQSAAFDPSGATLLAGGFNDAIYLHRVAGGEPRVIHKIPNAFPSGISFDPSGRKAVIHVSSMADRSKHVLEILDLATGSVRRFPSSIALAGSYRSVVQWDSLGFAADGTLYSAGAAGVWRWDLSTGTKRVILGTPKQEALMAMSGDGRTMLVALGETPNPKNEALLVIDTATGARRKITTHGTFFTAIAINRTGTIIATTDATGLVRVGRASGDEPHLLFGHSAATFGLAISPDNRWVASQTQSEIRMWPMPDMSLAPLHSRPHDALISKLHALTNLRAVPDARSSTGYRLEIGPFPGWKDNPTW